MIVLGIALTLVGILLLSVSAIVSGAVAAGQAGCTTSCSAVDPGAWLGWLGLPLLAFGLVLFLVGLWWGLRR